MSFDLEAWKRQLSERLKDWKPQARRLGVNSLYAGLSAAALWPVAQACQSGDLLPAMVALGGVVGGVGGNLIANQVQGWKDESDAAHQLEEATRQPGPLVAELDAVLAALDVLEQARVAQAAGERQAFQQALAAELQRLGSRLAFSATLIGDGVQAAGDGAAAVGPGGTLVLGQQNSLQTGDIHDLNHAQVILATGNVLVQSPPPGASPEALRQAYLHFLLEKTSYLSLAGIDPKAASDSAAGLSLGQVYTALLTRTVDAPEHGRAGEPFAGREAERLPALEQLNRHGRLVLLGDPGSGKTTFVNFLAMCLAGELLGRPDANLALLAAPLPAEGDDDEPRPQQWDLPALLPVRVILRDLAAGGLPPAGERATARHLWDFIAADLDAAALAEYAEALKRELLERGGLLLLDGLDEAPEAEQRRAQIKQAVEAFAAAYPKCRILVTSRTYAYQNQAWRLQGFTETVLAPFSRGQISQFVQRWYAHIAGLRGLKPEDAGGRAELLQRAIFASERLLELAERPLLLTLMASLHAWRGGTLPEKREELYADTVELLLDWWESPKAVRDRQGKLVFNQPALAEWLNADRLKVRKLLEALAFKAHAAQPELQGTADIAEGDLVSGLMQLSGDATLNPAQLVRYLTQRAGLLIPRGVGVYTFPHRTFQEYLAACYLTDHDYPDSVADLVCQDFNRWREAALLAGAKAGRGSAAAIWLLVDALCCNDPPQAQPAPADLWAAYLAGQALLESVDLEAVGPRSQPKLARVRRWLVQVIGSPHLPTIERAAAGRALARLGDPRSDATTLPGMRFCWVPAGPFRLGSDTAQDPQADSDETPAGELDLAGFWIGQHPVTQAQYAAFVQAGGYREAQWWPEAAQAGAWRDGQIKRWRDDQFVDGPDDYGEPYSLSSHPVVGVCWYEALAFTRWMTAQGRRQGWLPGGWELRLPSEAEWEKAARGGLRLPQAPLVRAARERLLPPAPALSQENPHPARRYPWGQAFDAGRANVGQTGIGTTSAVGCFPGGASPLGALELSGNILEWTRSLYGKNYNLDYAYPYRSDDGREDLAAGKDVSRVVRGGAFDVVEGRARCAFRFRYDPLDRFDLVGFRVAAVPSALTPGNPGPWGPGPSRR